ncbi:signal transducer and activator of transcription 6 isoform X3 [Ascaphus truei]|uniref:signal transducer and activator of transcription 6 isoform X3 n=1 Tax=Ascaphus truei TaxID=8439 RepID=UPI003F5A1BBF
MNTVIWSTFTGTTFVKMAKVSMWSYVSKMPPEKFEKVYYDFPQKVRHLLADWLENQPWEFINENDLFCNEMAHSLLQRLVEELERTSGTCGSEAHMVLQFANDVKRMSQQEPMKIVQLFKSILEGEKMVVFSEFPRLRMMFCQKQEEMQFNVGILRLKHKIKETTMLQEQLKLLKENVRCHEQMQEVANLQRQWSILVNESIESLKTVQLQAIKRLNIWKRQQQLVGNGATFDEDLLPLQERLEAILDMYFEMDRIAKTNSLIGLNLPPGFSEQINSSLGILVKSSLLVDKQPPQVLKTQTKFQASVNFLLGSRLLKGVIKMPVVRAIIITEKKARDLVVSPASEPWKDGTGEIENGKSTLEINPNSKTCGAVFKSMLLKKIKRCERKGSESVTEEKCAVLFIAEITLNSCDRTFHLQTLSLPLVVIVHGNQDNNAKATILWDNAFSEVERHPFYVEEKVPWSKMCHTLNLKFVSEVGTKHELQTDHFVFLAQKIFNDNNLTKDDFPQLTVSWAQFNKELLQGRNFTFWQWFDGVVELTRKCLTTYWSDKLIEGFISKQKVHNILICKPNGTFLLRFSDSEIGGITIAHILRGDDGSSQIQNIQPFSAKDLDIRSLADRVRDLKQLQLLYKNKPKDEAFEKHYSKDQVTKNPNGYIPASIAMRVEGSPNFPSPPAASSPFYPSHDRRILDDSLVPSRPVPYWSPNIPLSPAGSSPFYLSQDTIPDNSLVSSVPGHHWSPNFRSPSAASSPFCPSQDTIPDDSLVPSVPGYHWGLSPQHGVMGADNLQKSEPVDIHQDLRIPGPQNLPREQPLPNHSPMLPNCIDMKPDEEELMDLFNAIEDMISCTDADPLNIQGSIAPYWLE